MEAATKTDQPKNQDHDDFSIMRPERKASEPPEAGEPFYQDLNLLQVFERIRAKWGRETVKCYRDLPATPEETAYRRAVYGDVKKEPVYAALMRFTRDLEEVDGLCAEKEKVRIPLQRAVWQIREADRYCRAYEDLRQGLEKAEVTAEGLQAFLRILQELQDSAAYKNLKNLTERLLGRIKSLRFVITYEKDRMSVELRSAEGGLEGSGAYEERMQSQTGRAVRQLRNPFLTDPTLSGIEKACLEILMKKEPAFFKELQETADRYEGYRKPVQVRFESEIRFYLSYCMLQREMEQAGYAFCAPRIAEGETLEAAGLYDLALALTNLSEGKEVVPNDCRLGDGERFFVLTGPNQGGKTTFARSLGQLVYLTKMGLDVPAVSAVLPVYPRIQTHFSVEESVETGRGKLMEELVRLAPMMEEHKKGSFVVINELFTTAANYDALIMGKKVLDHFIGLGCMGIYVTHLQELAQEREGVVSLRAQRNEQGVRTFRIMRGDADDSACAEDVVKKYHLTYEELKERL